jgi:hypothetical protein
VTDSRRAAPPALHPALVFGASTAAVWLLTTTAYALVAGLGLPVPMGAVGLVFPGTIPGWLASSAGPWPVLGVVVSALAAGALAFALAPLVLSAAGPQRRGLLLLALWFVVLLAAALVGGLVALGGIAAYWPPLRLLDLVTPVAPAVATATYWGLLWGWLPTVLAARALGHGAAAPEGGRARWLRPVPAVLFGMLLVAAFPLAQAANRAEAPEPPVAEPLPEPVVYGSPGVSAAVEDGAPESPNPSGEPWCTGGDTAVVLGGGDAAIGHRAQELRITNTGDADCLLARYPDIAFDDEGGFAMSVLVFRGGTFMTDDPGLEPRTLPPGGSARALLGWNAMAAAGDVQAGAVLVAPYAGTGREKLPLVLDIVNGGAVAVTAWHADGA